MSLQEYKTMNNYTIEEYDVKKEVLSNGLKVYYYSNPLYTISSCAIRIGSGAFMETKGVNSGWTHLLEHMIFKSSEKYTTRERNEFFAENCVDTNAFTDLEDIFFYFDCPNKIFEKTFDVYMEMLFNPLLKEDELKTERKVVIAEMKERSISPSKRCYDVIRNYGYSKESRGTFFTNSVIGTISDLNNCTSDKLRDWYEKFFDPRNITIAMVGGPRDYNKLIKKLEAFNLKQHEFDIVSAVNEQIKIAKKFNHRGGFKVITQNERKSVLFYLVKNGMADVVYQGWPEYLNLKHAYKAFMCNGLNSLLWTKLREEKGYVYGVHLNSQVSCYDSSNYIIVEVNENYVEQFLNEYSKTMAEFKKTGLDNCTFKKLMKSIKNNYPFEKNDAHALACSIITFDSIGVYPLSAKEHYKNYNLVTKEEILDYHKTFFDNYKYFICAMSSPNKKKDVIEAIKKSGLTKFYLWED